MRKAALSSARTTLRQRSYDTEKTAFPTISSPQTHTNRQSNCEICGLERFRFTCCHLKIVRGGVFLRKTPLCVEDSVKSRIETALAGPSSAQQEAPQSRGIF